jgi:hypothetical protein
MYTFTNQYMEGERPDARTCYGYKCDATNERSSWRYRYLSDQSRASERSEKISGREHQLTVMLSRSLVSVAMMPSGD